MKTSPLDPTAGKMESAPAEEGRELDATEKEDVEAGFELAANILLDEKSVDALLQALSGNGDPGAIVGAFIGKMLLSVIPKMKQEGPQVSDNAWMADNGIADRLIDEAGGLYKELSGEEFTPEMHDTAFMEIMDMLKSAQASGAQPGMEGEQQEAPPQGAPAPVPQMAPQQGGF